MRRIALFYIVLILLFVSLACNMPFAITNNDMPVENRAIPSEEESQTMITPLAQQRTVVPEIYENTSPIITQINQLPDFDSEDQESGEMCFVSQNNGMACFGKDGWNFFNTQSGKLESNYINAVTQCMDENILIAQSGQISVFSPDGERSLLDFPEGFYASVEDLACYSANDFWFTHFEGITHYINQSWEIYPITQIVPSGLEYALVEKIIIDQSGSLWITLPNFVVRYQDQTWTVFGEENGFSDQYFIEDILETPDGIIFAAASIALLRNQGNYWEAINYPENHSIAGITLDPDGNIWVYGDRFLWRYALEEQSWQIYDLSVNEFPDISEKINHLRIDQAGNFWMATNWGTTIWDGITWQTLLMRNSEIIEDQIEGLFLLGETAPIPPIFTEDPGIITGSIYDENEQPLIGIQVQICVESISDYTLSNLASGEKPCSLQPYYQEVSTNDSGEFTFENVPEGYYYLTAETEPGNWLLLTGDFGFGEQIPVFSGEEVVLGQLFVTQDES